MLLEQLATVVGPSNVLAGEAVRARNVEWGRTSPCLAKALVRPKSTDEVSQILKLCNAHGQSVVVHGGLTGLVRGAVASEHDIVLSLERMRGVGDLDVVNRTLICEAGVPLQVAQEAAASAGLLLALDIGARGSATIGGTIATNAGGIRVLRYGTMREQVLGLEAVLADGTVVSSMNELVKNNTGYDLKQLFIGSEGTLGVVTRAVLRLRSQATSQNTALIAMSSFSDVIRLLHAADAFCSGALSAFEVMWRSFYELATESLAADERPLTTEHPLYVLLESLDTGSRGDGERFESMLAELTETGIIGDAVLATSEAQRRSLWALRENVEPIFKMGPVVNFDVSLPIGSIPHYVARVEATVLARWSRARMVAFGHLGDNNLHLSIVTGDNRVDAHEALSELVYDPLLALRGAVSAEHGIGLEKARYLPLSRSVEEIGLMRRLKLALDPKGILNPGRVVAASS